MEIEGTVGDARKQVLTKLAEGAIRARSGALDTYGAVSSVMYEAIRGARDVATKDEPYRNEASGFCWGVRQFLRALKLTQAYYPAMEIQLHTLLLCMLVLLARTADDVKLLQSDYDEAMIGLASLDHCKVDA